MAWDKKMPKNPVVAVCGATGAVGQEMLLVLAQRKFPAAKVKALASAKSAGREVDFDGGKLTIEEMTPESFDDVDIALSALKNPVAKEYRPHITKAGAVMIDNSSAFRMDKDVPLIVPEVNPQDIAWHDGVIANPNCSTIQMVVALNALNKVSHIKRVVVSTYQAASGAGAEAMKELYDQTRDFLDGKPVEPHAFAHQIAFNCIPHIDVFLDDDSTKEEWKMVVETKKIMGDESIEVAPTCVRVPVLRCHAESINVEFDEPITVEQAREAFEQGANITVMDDPANNVYPMPGLLAGTDDTYVGRIRKDPTVENGIAFWCVADQIRKGAALNAVQIAEALL